MRPVRQATLPQDSVAKTLPIGRTPRVHIRDYDEKLTSFVRRRNAELDLSMGTANLIVVACRVGKSKGPVVTVPAVEVERRILSAADTYRRHDREEIGMLWWLRDGDLEHVSI